jgi:hypothetical protein
VYWVYLSQDRNRWRSLVNTAMNLLVSENTEEFLSGQATGGFTRKTRLLGVSAFLINVMS